MAKQSYPTQGYRIYRSIKPQIDKALNSFKELSESNWQNELFFCLLTPQSNAHSCWEAVVQLNQNNFKNITQILSKKTRFHHTKTTRIKQAKEQWPQLKEKIKSIKNVQELRESIVKEVNGLGLKEASHFIRNIGKSNNQVAILDRHILRRLYAHHLIKDPDIPLTKKTYLEIEEKMKKFSKDIKIPLDHLDLLFWHQATGEIFK